MPDDEQENIHNFKLQKTFLDLCSKTYYDNKDLHL